MEAVSIQLLSRLQTFSDKLEDYTRKKAAPGSHTEIAKDQPGHDPSEALADRKTAKFWYAQSLSEQANRLVLGSIPRVFRAASTAEASGTQQAIFATLDGLIAPPSAGHPLAAIIDEHVKKIGKK